MDTDVRPAPHDHRPVDQTSPCPFCEIVAGRAPAVIIQEWSDAIAIEPLHPVTDGHLLVMPKAHVTDFRADPIATGAVMIRAAFLAGYWVDDVNLITSDGPAATQTIDHLHVHLIPRRPDDGLALPWDGVRP